jgi:hypothetical protein
MRSIKVTIDNEKNLALAKDILNAMKFVIEVKDLDDDDNFQLSPEMLTEVKRRRQELHDNPESGLTLEELGKEIRAKYGF